MCLCCFVRRRSDRSKKANVDSNQQSTFSSTTQQKTSFSVQSEPRFEECPPQSFTCNSSSDKHRDKEKTVNVANVLNCVKIAKRTKKGPECNFEEKRRYLKKAHRAMGLQPNVALVDRYARRARRLERTQTEALTTDGQETHTRKGDTLFSLPVTKLATESKKESDKEQTPRKPRLLSDDAVAPDNDELNDTDDHQEDVDDKNFMYHDREIAFTCHDMMQQVGNIDILTEAGILDNACRRGASEGRAGEKRTFNFTWNPLALIEELTARRCFDCFTLRKNTFISNSSAMPLDDERKDKNKVLTEMQCGFEDCVKDLDTTCVPAVSPSLSCKDTLSSHVSYTQNSEVTRTRRIGRARKKVSASSKRPSASKRGRSRSVENTAQSKSRL